MTFCSKANSRTVSECCCVGMAKCPAANSWTIDITRSKVDFIADNRVDSPKVIQNNGKAGIKDFFVKTFFVLS